MQGHSTTSSDADLRLARACAAGDDAAIRRFDQLVAAVEVGLARRGFSAMECSEVAQRLRVRMLTRDENGEPRILAYSGRGALEAWLRVAALRLALNLRRETQREEALDDAMLEEACACSGHTAESLRHEDESRRAFVAAFREAFAALSPRERNVLRLHHVHAVELQDLAAAYAVHRITVGRWIESARDRLRRGVEQRLASELALRLSEAARLVYSVRVAADLNVRELLPSSAPCRTA